MTGIQDNNTISPFSDKSAVLTADWVVPVTDHVFRNGAVWVHEDVILWAGPLGKLPPEALSVKKIRLPAGYAILPGLVNCHAHLELSCLGIVGEPGRTFADWMFDLVNSRKEPASEDQVTESAREAASAAAVTGTVAIADVGNTGLAAAVIPDYFKYSISFLEVLGHDPAEAAAVYNDAVDKRATLRIDPKEKASLVIVPHTPYTVSRKLFEILAEREEAGTVHLAEIEDEDDFLLKAEGSLRRLIEKAGTWSEQRTVPRLTGMEVLKQTGYLKPGLLIAHAIHLEEDALLHAASAGAVPVACPVSNRHTGAGSPPVPRWLKAGLTPCLGTDSIASGTGMNLFADMLELLNSEGPPDPSTIIGMATINGAAALGLGEKLGSIAHGKEALLIAVPVNPPGETAYRLPGEPGTHNAGSNLEEELCRRIIRAGAAGKVLRPWN